MSNIADAQLIDKAIAAATHSHSPYSHFRVGAALLAQDGRVFVGTNIENASYGLTICAERSAFGSAITAGAREFDAIAIVASGEEPPLPCGACRQVMAEFCQGDLTVLLASISMPEQIQTYRLDALLPHAFSL
ncbi:MAG: cytidine deaminase [Verrucomicrobia bacterium]|jgi:cytidine deaminase|nr:cytidine deaminase [Verrucomicrobiota bacterium]